jgi:hypothetical protein
MDDKTVQRLSNTNSTKTGGNIRCSGRIGIGTYNEYFDIL